VLVSLVALVDAAGLKLRPATTAGSKTAKTAKTATTAPAVDLNMSADQREALFQKLLARYCKVISAAPSTAPIPVKLSGWPALQIPSSSVMGLVLLGEGNTRTKGPHARQLDKLYNYVAMTSTNKIGASHESWPLAFAVLFLSEVHRKTPSAALHARIAKLVKRLESGAQGDKGWNHGLKNSGYGPFVGVTIWCTAALGAAREQGVPVNKARFAAALNGLEKSLGRSGGAFYYTLKHRSDVKPGRTGGVAWVLSRYGQSDPDKIALSRQFLIKHVDAAPKGHASWMMNMGWAALGASSADDKTREAFWAVHRKTILQTHDPRAFFRVQKWDETGFRDSPTSKPIERGEAKTWPDPMYGDHWATVWMFLVWQAERGKSLLAVKSKQTAVIAKTVSPSFDEKALLERIAKGQGASVRKELLALMRKHPGHAGLYRLKALTYVPELLKPFDPSERNLGSWRSTSGSAALRYLSIALLRKTGKGDVSDEFDNGVRLLRARLYAKQAATAYRPKSTAWVNPYNRFIKEIRTILQFNSHNGEAVKILNAVKKAVEIEKLKKRPQRKTTSKGIQLR